METFEIVLMQDGAIVLRVSAPNPLAAQYRLIKRIDEKYHRRYYGV